MKNTDEQFMQIALTQAKLAYKCGEVPVGAVIIHDNQILAKAHNCPIKKKDPTAHAEVEAIRKACRKIGNYRLPDATLYTTLEPCAMCVGAILQARIKRVVYGADDPKSGAAVSLYRLFDDKRFNHTVEIAGGVRKEACREILRGFFQEKRILSPSVLKNG